MNNEEHTIDVHVKPVKKDKPAKVINDRLTELLEALGVIKEQLQICREIEETFMKVVYHILRRKRYEQYIQQIARVQSGRFPTRPEELILALFEEYLQRRGVKPIEESSTEVSTEADELEKLINKLKQYQMPEELKREISQHESKQS